MCVLRYVGITQQGLRGREVPMREQGPEFKQAKYDELMSIIMTKSVAKIPIKDATNLITCWWVCTLKFDESGNIIRHKARLVAKGFLDKDKHFMDTETVCPGKETARYVTFICVQFQWTPK